MSMALLVDASANVCWTSGPPFWASVGESPVIAPRLPGPHPRFRLPVWNETSMVFVPHGLMLLAENPWPAWNAEVLTKVSRRNR